MSDRFRRDPQPFPRHISGRRSVRSSWRRYQKPSSDLHSMRRDALAGPNWYAVKPVVFV